MTSTPADGTEPNRPAEDGPLAPTAPGTPTTQPLTRTQKILIGIVTGAVLTIATLGFIGSYTAVTHLATRKGFGQFAHAFPIAVDAGIIAFLALDLLLTWRRIPYPLLRYTAWGLTAATIAFNAVVSWPDPVGVSMHGVIPILFVIAVEAARHAVGRIAEITADKHLEGPNVSRWFLNPVNTFILWRRQRLWKIRTWDEVLELERERRIYIGKLRKDYGRSWRRKAKADQLLVLRLAKDGMSVTDAMALPAKEEEKRRQEEARIAREKQEADDKRRREQQEYEAEQRRKADEYEREQKRLEDERIRQEENDRLERERKALKLEQDRQETARQQRIADAEAQAKLDEIARRSQEAQADIERRQRQDQLEHAKQLAAEQQKAALAAKAKLDAEEATRREAERKRDANQRAAEVIQRTANASPVPASRTANASRPAANQAANAIASAPANGQTESASPASASTATSRTTANANASQAAATSAGASANTVDINQVVEVYQLLKAQEGKAPSDAKLGQALGVSRSRAQQLRTAAIEAGHAELAKPLRIAS
ncbi:DUF2637 domain-containing protein [Streptomyces antimycoticus]|uniref:DUF2637 domain-containing protein n=1 Tax=Streptomyces antimycoticus TaxID=68175 RepID=UPI00367AF063